MKKIITYGTFDLLHYGHINLLQRAKALGDYLIVGVTSEDYDIFRGKFNVREPLMKRIENIINTGYADEVIIEEYEGQKIDDIQRLKVDTFVIGSDWVEQFDYLREFCNVEYLDRTKGISSTYLRSSKIEFTKFGIVGTGRIATRFVEECRYVSGINIASVFNIRKESAISFSDKMEVPFPCDNFDEFLENIDVIYIASPHGTHYNYTLKALQRGKHVLCEKPMTLTKNQIVELYDLARTKNIVLMEALKTAYCPGFKRLVSIAKSGKIGEIVAVDATFTKLVSKHSRERNPEMDGGSLFELGSYPLLAIFKILGTDYSDVGWISKFDSQIDLFTNVNVDYPQAIGSAFIGLGVKKEGDMVISGTRGYIYVPAPWWKTEYFEIRYENPQEVEKFFYKFLGDGLRYEIVEFLEAISGNNIEVQEMSSISIKIAEVMDKFKQANKKSYSP